MFVLDKWPIGSQVYVFHPAQIDFVAFIIEYRGRGIGREVKVRWQRQSHEYDAWGFDDEWILERSWRINKFIDDDEDDYVEVP
jgi:hypothetical protein